MVSQLSDLLDHVRHRVNRSIKNAWDPISNIVSQEIVTENTRSVGGTALKKYNTQIALRFGGSDVGGTTTANNMHASVISFV